MQQLLILLVLALAAPVMAEESKTRSACEEEAHKYFPDPNFEPRSTGAGQFGGPGGRTDFTTSVPSASDYERARQKRNKYIKDCLAGANEESAQE